MKSFYVKGQALGVVDVQHSILANSEKEAMEKATKLFTKGEHGLINYSDDDAAALDYSPLFAEEVEPDGTEL